MSVALGAGLLPIFALYLEALVIEFVSITIGPESRLRSIDRDFGHNPKPA